jgi:PAS domain S-box-containing protein
MPSLQRLLADSARSHAALCACGFPLAMLDAAAPARPLTYVNPAFEGFFGYRAADALGRSLAALLFRDDAPLVHRLLAAPGSRWKVRVWGKDGAPRHVEISIGAVHAADGVLTHWVAAFSDRSEAEALRAELDGLRSLAAAA